MLLNKPWQYGLLLLVAIPFFAFITFTIYEKERFAERLDACNSDTLALSAKIDDIMREKFSTEGTAAAFEVFETVYKNYPDFADSGCHRHAHRVGDMAYYFDYLTHRELALVDFPKGATACGYGFYHGFFEHMVQDRPESEFVEGMCEYAKENLVDVAPAIGQTCYHGSGHGFLLARADEILAEHQWANIDAFIMKPLEQCEQLQGISEEEMRECREGVYNVFTDWMATGEYGLSLNKNDPYALCKAQRDDRQKDCYAEMSQKLDWFSDYNPQKMVEIIQAVPRQEFQGLMMAVGVAGLVQHNPLESQEEILKACVTITDKILRRNCIYGIIGGLAEHSTPGSDYRGALEFCALSLVPDDEVEGCYKTVLAKLDRFFTRDELNTRCEKGTLPHHVCTLLAQE